MSESLAAEFIFRSRTVDDTLRLGEAFAYVALSLFEEHQAAFVGPCAEIVIALDGPRGSGKTTFLEGLVLKTVRDDIYDFKKQIMRAEDGKVRLAWLSKEMLSRNLQIRSYDSQICGPYSIIERNAQQLPKELSVCERKLPGIDVVEYSHKVPAGILNSQVIFEKTESGRLITIKLPENFARHNVVQNKFLPQVVDLRIA